MLSFDIAVALKTMGSNLDPLLLEAFILAESSGKGFDDKTGKIKIQFEPKPFFNRTSIWIDNKIDVQGAEWDAFNKAFKINAVAAMESTSIGLAQIMGYHWKRLGYDSVGAMWDSFKSSLVEQICGLIKFINTDARLLKAFKEYDYHRMALYYNGAGYVEQAIREKNKPYNEKIRDNYERLKNTKTPAKS